jgi:hypothetical protein
VTKKKNRETVRHGDLCTGGVAIIKDSGFVNRNSYITKLCRQQAEVIQNHDSENVRTIGQGEARHRKYKRLKLGGGQAYDRSSV